jgi:hypothetical protein
LEEQTRQGRLAGRRRRRQTGKVQAELLDEQGLLVRGPSVEREGRRRRRRERRLEDLRLGLLVELLLELLLVVLLLLVEHADQD